MCGICGVFNYDGRRPELDIVRAMCDTILHRGPDDEGIHVDSHVGLGQRRLTIIDLAASACPPLCNEDRTVWLVFNGEIYNFQQLRQQLIELGHRFATNSDTEVIIHLYEEEGVECLQKLRGMFAFALWDQRHKMLFCARDRIGKKPFCYAKTPWGLVFGSEIKAITAHPGISRLPDFFAIEQYLTHSYVPAPHTAFAGINRLPPGHYLTCDREGNFTVECYWAPRVMPKTTATPAEIRQQLIERLSEAVKLRMIADVPLGAFLSGGIDSATIVALMARHSDRPVKTFSIGFDHEKFNELPYARLIAQKYGTEHHELVVKPDAVEVLPLLVKHYNEPFADSSAIPSYYVSQMTRKSVTVALSGDGGDESFAGYQHYADLLAWSRLDAIPASIRKLMTKLGQSAVRPFSHNNFAARIERGLAMLSARDIKARRDLSITTFKASEKNTLYSQQFNNLIAAAKTRTDRIAEYPITLEDSELDWLMRHDQSFYLPDCLMVKTDIASMANGLEVRSPFLDHEFIEFAATLPAELKRDPSGGKIILKSAVADLLPPEILNKPKTGFGIPLASWLRVELAPMLREALLSDRSTKRGLFKPEAVSRLVNEHIDGHRDWSNRLYALLFLELWFREFID